ncbi:RelA/SpoT family protein [Desulfoluna spongiiphila]|uniref:GTP pyrophosphokinase n=1 Tax=Desulfoluna spongiiphila TaxID=419481 RepID=A0A1G5GTU3_9BACT|nr:bifunctional (p)ppGpp synthetase/guanosine-3',5'-bis(diphosphate) 3'-pyrophosphohydrolase [Desulfoluna spongiiphila]SCY54068.1 GTP pyrophosphokinase [Desulfoluna spongiiphila]VVS92858.1 rela/spot [Desulfoluna spongiiphila]
MIRINDILDRIIEIHPDADLDIVERAYIFSARVHDGQTRLSGEPYLTHPLEVAYILADMKLDVESVAAALLHDVVEDTHATEEEIAQYFGTGVCHIVAGVTKLSKLSFATSQQRQAESIRKMILAMANDIRVILIKLADRLHNMRTLKFHKKEEKKKQIAKETMDLYVPIASRLGIYWLKQELEDMAFDTLLPDEYKKIREQVKDDQLAQEEMVATTKKRIRELMEDAGLHGQVMGRYKQLYSIYHKMISQQLSFDEIYDLVAFRIILDTIPQCYTALGIIHSTWSPIAGKFKDYIGVPKPNMYQSLHTTVVGPGGHRIEVQIRTKEMDKVAKSGIAAHWSYKEGKVADEKLGEAYAWVQDLVENQENVKNPGEFMENVRIDLFQDEVYVFSPKGEIKTLPKGATPIDFAYAIHTEVGNQCSGAKVNGRLVSLTYELQTGDAVEIIITKGNTPSKDWIGFVKTVKARSRIRHFIRSDEKEHSVALGKDLLEKEFRKHSLNFNKLSATPEMEEASTAFGYKGVSSLIENVGYGKVTPRQVVNRFLPQEDKQPKHEPSLFHRLMGRSRKKKEGDAVIVKGIDNILIRLGKCCNPVPGDEITGYVTQGQGITIHRSNCTNALTLSPERCVDVTWANETQESLPVSILVRSQDQVGLLAKITSAISDSQANIVDLVMSRQEQGGYECTFTLNVSNTDQIKKVIQNIKRIRSVREVRRIGD